MKYISKNSFLKLLELLKKDYQLYAPFKKGNQRFYGRYYDYTDDIVLGEVRPFEPLKAFFSRAREVVARDFDDSLPHENDKPYAILGVKACDLKGFKVQDFVFKEGDPIYLKNREENLIISADCTCAIDTCFCMALGLSPYPKENFDLNISLLANGFIVEAGSPKGEQLIERHPTFFQDASKELIAERDRKRLKVIEAVEKNIQDLQVPNEKQFERIIESNFQAPLWQEEAKTCVECGACNTICPTCHCFLLYDQKDEKKMARLRMWDSCMIKDFARVAGGANPRAKLWMRLRNRFEKKFDYFPKVSGVYACTGCGRCISACPAKIDIRKVLKRLVDHV